MARLTRTELTKALSVLPLNGYPNRVRYAVVIARIPQNDVAAAVDIHISALSQIIRGPRVPTAGQKAAIARYFGVPISVLFPSDDHAAERVA